MAETHSKTVLSHGKKSVDIIEFDKGFYNKKSVVLMPAKVGSDDGPTGDAKDTNNLMLFEGVAGLAAVYKQFEHDPRRRLILTGHTDQGEGSDLAIEFDLAKKRAEAVYCLLAGKKDRWAQLAREKHCLQDCKWLMTYFKISRPAFDCDPGGIDDSWNDNTYKAVKKFFKAVKDHLKLTIKHEELADQVKEHDEKLWPEVIWKAVFELYIEDICTMGKIKKDKIGDVRTKKLKFAKTGKQFIGCGASFPLKDPQKSNYQKDEYRRVEALFFYYDHVPGYKKRKPKFVCPAAVNKAHEAKHCPIYFDKHFYVNYIKPLDDLNMIAYHMKFDFFNLLKIKNKKPQIRQVPEGLQIQAYNYTGTGASVKKEKILTITKYHKGIYTIKVPDDKDRKNIHFEFSNIIKPEASKKRRWVYTKNKSAAPKLEIKSDTDIEKLMKPGKYSERICYYDLPHEWSSENYWTRYKEGAAWKSGRFHDVLKKLKLKPYDKEAADINNPLIFSLDDIVLVDADGKQDIKDKKQDDTSEKLSSKSRLALFHVVKKTLAVYKPRNDDSIQTPKIEAPFFSSIDFKKEKSAGVDVYRNVITDVPPLTRGILFANDFYSVFDKRAGQKVNTFDPKKFHVKGCRAACLKDADVHCPMIMKAGGYFDTGSKITLTGGNKTVNGTGAKFVGNVKPGYKIQIWDGLDGTGQNKWKAKEHVIQTVNSNTQVTLVNAPAPADAGNNLYFRAVPPHHLYFCEVVGNYELHYIHFGCPVNEPGGLKVRSFLLVYWNGRYKDVTDTTLAAPYHTVTANDVENFERIGCKNAIERWNQKEYLMEPYKLDADGKGKVQIMPVFFFEAKKSDRGGKHKCLVSVTNRESDGEMGVDNSKMYYLDYKIRNYLSAAQYGGPARFRDIDGEEFEGLTCSHEYGHAMGLFDDYAYHYGEHKTSDDAYFGQWYLGMPYHHDLGSMMQTNRAPRLKEMYHFLNRINDAAKNNDELKKILNETEYQAVNRYKKGGSTKTMRYHLKKSPNDYRDIYKPFKLERGRNTGTGKADLYLYKLGVDEMARTIKINGNPPGFPFDGIQVVFLKIGFDFKDFHDTSDPDPTKHKWNRWTDPTAPDKSVWMENVRSEIKNLNHKYYLKNNGAKRDFKHTFIFFFPVCLDYKAVNAKAKAAASGNAAAKTAAGNAAEAATKAAANYTIEVTYNKTNKVVARAAPLTTLKVGNLANKKWIAKYIVGKDPGGTTAGNPGNITKADFRFVQTWIRSNSGLNDNSFNIIGT